MSTPTNIPETPMSETEPGSFFESKEKFQQQLQHIFQTTLRLIAPDQFDQLCQWMEYRQYLTIDDLFDTFRKDPEKFDTKGPATEYKWKGKMNHISPNVAQKLKSFVRWMIHEERPYELHDGFLATLRRDSYLKFRHLDTQPLPTLPPSHHESQQHMTSFPSEPKQPTQSESKIALNNFKKGTKRDASVYPIFKNDNYYDTFQRSFLANLKARGLYDVADPDYDSESGDIYEQELFQGKQSFVYSVLVASLQTEKGRELVKEFEGDARSIILKLHHHHTKSNVAQHDIITLTTDITNLTLNDSWKGTVRQFLSHFKEKLRLLDSLVPVSDQLPETTRITFLQRAVQQNHDLRQIHVMDSVWRFKTESTDTLTFETYYNLLWDAAHQYDLHHTKKGPQRKAFLSQHEKVNDEDGYIIEEEQSFNDSDPEEDSSPYSVYQSSFHPKMPQKSYLPPKIWETLSESTKQMIIEPNKKVKLNNPTPYPSGSKTKPNPTLGKPTPAPKQVHQHSQDEPTEEPPPDTSTRTLVNKCPAESGIDPTDIQNVMPVSYAKRKISPHESSRQIQTHQGYVFARVNHSKHHPCDDLDPTDTPSAVPTALQAPSNDTYNPKCTHSVMETQCNHSQYPILMKKICTHHLSTNQVSKSYKPHPVPFPYPPDPGEHVLETSSAPKNLVERDKLDLSSLIPPKGEMKSSFSWTCPFKSPTSSTLCFGEPTLGKINQETDVYMTKHMPKPSSGANRVSVSHSSLVTKNGEHFYGENFIHDFPKSWKHIKEVDWGDKLKLSYTPYGYMLMEIDWGGKFNYTSCGHPMANWQGHETHPTGHKTSEVDWGGHDPNGSDNPPPMFIINLDDLLGSIFLLPMDENGERKRATISEHVKDQVRFKLKIDGDQLDDLNPNHVNESLLSEVDWGAHNPDTDDPEQLTGESIQSFLTFVVQLQWLVTLGRLVTHAQVTTLSKLVVASS